MAASGMWFGLDWEGEVQDNERLNEFQQFNEI